MPTDPRAPEKPQKVMRVYGDPGKRMDRSPSQVADEERAKAHSRVVCECDFGNCVCGAPALKRSIDRALAARAWEVAERAIALTSKRHGHPILELVQESDRLRAEWEAMK